ncbi:MAG: response regulator [Bacteroidota bacterium]
MTEHGENKKVTRHNLIVLAEDSLTQAEQIKQMLEKAGYRVLHAINGLEGFDMIKRNKPTLIISDVIMPEMDGYELCKRVKSDEELEDIPVVLLTSLAEPTDIIMGLECGANNFITKPFNEHDLLNRINNICTTIELRKHSHADIGIGIFYAGKKYHITSERMQILDMLLSSYENSIRNYSELLKANRELDETKRELESLNKNLEKEVEKRSKRILRLNALLEAIHRINSLIVKETEPQKLLQKACDNLHAVRNYRHVLIFTVDEQGKVLHVAFTGTGPKADRLLRDIKKGTLPACCREVLSGKELQIRKRCSDACRDCPMYNEEKESGNHSIKLVYENRVLGILSIQQDTVFIDDKEEIDLISEVAGDLGFALNDMMLAKENAFAQSELRKRTSDLKKSETALRRAQHMANIGSWDYDIVREKHTWSEEMYRILGLNPDKRNPSYQQLLELIHPEDRNYYSESCLDSLKNHTLNDVTCRIIRPDGEVRFINERSESVSDGQGNLIRSMGTVQDITDRVRMEKQLILAKETALKSDKLKTSFLMNMSHEIRTPMNAIIGFTDLLSEPGLDGPDRSKFSMIIKENGQRLLHLIDDILDISRIETGQLVMKNQEVRLNRVVGELIETYSMLIQKGSKAPVEIIYGENSATNLKVFTDPNRLRQIISNLLDNAIKNTDKGSVEIGYYPAPSDTGDENGVVIYVKDTGRGIAPEDQETIFELFRKIESKDRLFDGIGLGLSISKNLVQLLGGEISVKSEPGAGSEFSFWLPLEKSEQPGMMKASQAVRAFQSVLDDKVILVAEDEESNFSLMKFAFKGTGAKLIHAEDGRKAVDICNTNIHIDLVLMDIKMPEMDGYAATKIIKKKRKGLPVIAITAFAMESDIKNCFEAGCDEFQAKPVNFDELFGKIEKCLEKQ